MTEIALIDSSADMNCIQEGLIPLKYYERSSERLTQILNYKLPNDHICFKTILKGLSSKFILRNPFITLVYPFLKTYFILPLIPKETDSLNSVIILKDTNKRRIYRTERSLSSLKTVLSLDDQLIEKGSKEI